MTDVKEQLLVKASDVTVSYPYSTWRTRGEVRALSSVSLHIERGQSHGLVGESGCGKSTLGRALLRLVPMRTGRVIFDGQDITLLRGRDLRGMRRRMQMVFQDPYSSLNPRFTVEDTLSEPLVIHHLCSRKQVQPKVISLLADVGLEEEFLRRYPHELSGGQRQRVGVARALAVAPEFIVADEPVSALDVSVQAQLLNLLSRLKKERGLTYLFISHDLRVVEHICEVVSVMYLGHMVERAPVQDLFDNPLHPYTQDLLQSMPSGGRACDTANDSAVELPSPFEPTKGCPYHMRCSRPDKEPACMTEVPAFEDLDACRAVACPPAMRQFTGKAG